MREWIKGAFNSNFVLGCFITILVLALVFGLLCFKGWILMLLWNAILIPLFSFGALKFWWAVGIILICNIVFKSTITITKNKGE